MDWFLYDRDLRHERVKASSREKDPAKYLVWIIFPINR